MSNRYKYLRLKEHIKISFVFLGFGLTIFAQDIDDEVTELLENAKHQLEINIDSSIYLASKVIKNTKIPAEKISAKTILGDAYQYKQDYEKAIDYYLSSIELSEKHNENQSLANAYNGLGMTFYMLGELQKAKKYITLAAEEKRLENDYIAYAIIRMNLAVLYTNLQQFDESNEILLETEKTLLKNESFEYLSNLYQTIGANFEVQESRLDSALVYYKKSIKIAAENEQIEILKTGYNNAAGLLIQLEEYDLALDYLRKAEGLLMNKVIDRINIALYENYVTLFDSLQNYKTALSYQQKADSLRQELFSMEKQKTIEELEVKYNTLSKERKILEQDKALQESKLLNEKSKNQLNKLIFFGCVIILILLAVMYYFWNENRVKKRLESEKNKVFENIVHEIKTPLTLILSPLKLIQDELNSNKKFTDNFNRIENNANKLNQLITDLLDASKLNKGHFKPVYSFGYVHEYINEFATSFNDLAEEKNMEFIHHFVSQREAFFFPKNVVEKVVFNLLENSFKYCKPGSKIDIYTEIKGEKLTIIVKDNGPGLKDADKKKIFNRFYRANQGSVSGTGLGLSITKELLTLVEGTIKVESELGKGTSFECLIPLKSKGTEKAEHANEADLKGTKMPTVLLVDDDEDMTSFLSEIFEDNYEILNANNGIEGIQMAEKLIPDIIITDILMPYLDGIELIQKVKSKELTRHIPIVALSAKASLENKLKGLDYGADVYISKPFSPKELLLTVKNLLKTIRINQDDFKAKTKEEKPFNERLVSDNKFVNNTVKLIIDNIDNSDFGVNELAVSLFLSRSQLHRKIKALTGFSSSAFIKMVRLEKAKDLLLSGDYNVTEVSYECGFSSQSHFTKSFTAYFSMSPTEFKEKA